MYRQEYYPHRKPESRTPNRFLALRVGKKLRFRPHLMRLTDLKAGRTLCHRTLSPAPMFTVAKKPGLTPPVCLVISLEDLNAVTIQDSVMTHSGCKTLQTPPRFPFAQWSQAAVHDGARLHQHSNPNIYTLPRISWTSKGLRAVLKPRWQDVKTSTWKMTQLSAEASPESIDFDEAKSTWWKLGLD
ncbi:hypothetical protein B0H19DRAFT_1084870 [Mycena capillaripes]|nr:hypothetical protein B0H19DRAFT_1084870 [Mycena capillaripes]